MLAGLKPQEDRKNRPVIPEVGYCAEKNRLLDEFLHAIQAMNALQNEQTHAVIAGDPDFSRFDILIQMAQERKDAAKYAWIAHVESHNCAEG